MLVWIEFARIAHISSTVASYLGEMVTKLQTKEEEKGAVVLSHILLLLGCSLPIMISSPFNSVHAYASIFGLCISDAFVHSLLVALLVLIFQAALIGAYLGEHKWPKSNKSVEGTLGSIVATYIFLSFIFNFVQFDEQVPEFPAILGFSLLLPAWEALSCLNDNISIPVVAYGLSKLLF